MTRDVQYSVYRGQSSRDHNLWKSDVQVDIYIKLTKSNPAVVFIAKV